MTDKEIKQLIEEIMDLRVAVSRINKRIMNIRGILSSELQVHPRTLDFAFSGVDFTALKKESEATALNILEKIGSIKSNNDRT